MMPTSNAKYNRHEEVLRRHGVVDITVLFPVPGESSEKITVTKKPIAKEETTVTKEPIAKEQTIGRRFLDLMPDNLEEFRANKISAIREILNIPNDGVSEESKTATTLESIAQILEKDTVLNTNKNNLNGESKTASTLESIAEILKDDPSFEITKNDVNGKSETTSIGCPLNKAWKLNYAILMSVLEAKSRAEAFVAEADRQKAAITNLYNVQNLLEHKIKEFPTTTTVTVNKATILRKLKDEIETVLKTSNLDTKHKQILASAKQKVIEWEEEHGLSESIGSSISAPTKMFKSSKEELTDIEKLLKQIKIELCPAQRTQDNKREEILHCIHQQIKRLRQKNITPSNNANNDKIEALTALHQSITALPLDDPLENYLGKVKGWLVSGTENSEASISTTNKDIIKELQDGVIRRSTSYLALKDLINALETELKQKGEECSFNYK